MTASAILSPAVLAGMRDRVLADAGEADLAALEALGALTDPELAALYYGYARAAQSGERGADLHTRAASYAHDAAGQIGIITPDMRAQVRAELAAALR